MAAHHTTGHDSLVFHLQLALPNKDGIYYKAGVQEPFGQMQQSVVLGQDATNSPQPRHSADLTVDAHRLHELAIICYVRKSHGEVASPLLENLRLSIQVGDKTVDNALVPVNQLRLPVQNYAPQLAAVQHKLVRWQENRAVFRLFSAVTAPNYTLHPFDEATFIAKALHSPITFNLHVLKHAAVSLTLKLHTTKATAIPRQPSANYTFHLQLATRYTAAKLYCTDDDVSQSLTLGNGASPASPQYETVSVLRHQIAELAIVCFVRHSDGSESAHWPEHLNLTISLDGQAKTTPLSISERSITAGHTYVPQLGAGQKYPLIACDRVGFQLFPTSAKPPVSIHPFDSLPTFLEKAVRHSTTVRLSIPNSSQLNLGFHMLVLAEGRTKMLQRQLRTFKDVTVYLREYSAEDLKPDPRHPFQHGFAVIDDKITDRLRLSAAQNLPDENPRRDGNSFVLEEISPEFTTFWRHERSLLHRVLFQLDKKVRHVFLLAYQRRFAEDSYNDKIHYDYTPADIEKKLRETPGGELMVNYEYELFNSRRAWSVTKNDNVLRPVEHNVLAITPTVPSLTDCSQWGTASYLCTDSYEANLDRFRFTYLAH